MINSLLDSVKDSGVISNSDFFNENVSLARAYGYLCEESRMGITQGITYESIVKNIPPKFLEDLVDLSLFCHFYSCLNLQLLDGKNKYANLIFKTNRLGVDNEDEKVLHEFLHGIGSFITHTPNISLDSIRKSYRDYTENKVGYPLRRIPEYNYHPHKHWISFLKVKELREILKSKVTIQDFRCSFSSSMNNKSLDTAIELMNVLGKDEFIIDSFKNVQRGGNLVSYKRGSGHRFNYFWKCISFEKREVFARIIFDEITQMKKDGNSSHLKLVGKVKNWLKENQEMSVYFDFKESDEESIFLASSYNAICIGLYVSSMQKVAKKNKTRISDTDGYINKISYCLNKVKSIDLFKDFISIVRNDKDTELVLDLVFKENKDYSLSREDVVFFYESALTRMVNNDYHLEKSNELIFVQEFLMERTLKNEKTMKDKKLFKV